MGFRERSRSASRSQFGHGLGVALYESPMISRLHSLDAPMTIEAGMSFALETYCAAKDGKSAARIEEMVLVTPTGPKIISRFPAEELLVTGVQYVRGADMTGNGDASGNGSDGLIGTSGFTAQQAVVASETNIQPPVGATASEPTDA